MGLNDDDDDWKRPVPLGADLPVTGEVRDLPARMADRLIVALDVDSVAEALALVRKLDGVVTFFKIGFRMLIVPGTDSLIDGLIGDGRKIFLDAKMFDIPETVETAVAAAARRGVSFITVHGDERIMRAAVAGRGGSEIKVFAVTVLTSLDDDSLKGMGYALTARELVQLRARQAVACGCDGIIASADDNPDAIRRLAGTQSLLIATPGVRRAQAGRDDHKRTATPREAIESGADYLVVGRPITSAPDPVAAAKAFIQEMEDARPAQGIVGK